MARPLPGPPAYEWRELKAATLAFQSPAPGTALAQAATTIGLLLILLTGMHASVALGWWWAVPVLALPAAAFTVRAFMLQHNCGHASMFHSRWANDCLGRLCS